MLYLVASRTAIIHDLIFECSSWYRGYDIATTRIHRLYVCVCVCWVFFSLHDCKQRFGTCRSWNVPGQLDAVMETVPLGRKWTVVEDLCLMALVSMSDESGLRGSYLEGFEKEWDVCDKRMVSRHFGDCIEQKHTRIDIMIRHAHKHMRVFIHTYLYYIPSW